MDTTSRAQEKLSFEYEVVPDKGQVTSYGGLPLVLDAMRALGVSQSIKKHVRVKKRQSAHDEAKVFEALVLTLVAGGECLDDLAMLGADKALLRLLGWESFPSPETARKLLYAFHDEKLIEKAKAALPSGEVAYVPEENEPLKGLGRVVADLVMEVAQRGNGTVATVDMDATIIESRKKEAKWHYDEGRGYQPEIAIWAEQDLVLADEFRDGNVPAAKDTLEVTKRAFAALPPSVTTRRFRGDSACYSTEQLVWHTQQGHEFTISAKMGEELRKQCAARPQSEWALLEKRQNEEVHINEVVHSPSEWQGRGLPYPRYLALRITPLQGRLFEEGAGPKYLAVCTNRKGPAEELVKWHWEKAGTVEHVHDVMKNELGAGTLPCGRFGANAAWFRLVVLTYNLLSALKSIALPADLHDARPKKLRFQIFTLPAIVSQHARALWARLMNRLNRATDVFRSRHRLWVPRPAPA
jgi:hypothetical protein